MRAIALGPQRKAERAGCDQRRDGDHRERDAIDGDMPPHAKRRDPRDVIRELIARDGLEAIDKADHGTEYRQRDEQGEVAGSLARERDYQQHNGGNGRDGDQCGNGDHVPRTKR